MNPFRWTIAGMWMVALSGCLSPHENLYSLDIAHAPAGLDNRPVTIVVGPVTLPQLVDRPQLVIRDGDYKVNVLEQERWATPLKESLPSLLAEELNQRFSDRSFVTAGSRAISAPAGRLVIDITRFDVASSGAQVSARWMYRPTDSNSPPTQGTSDQQSKAGSSGYEAMVEALQKASLAVADDIAGHLNTLNH